MTQTPKETSKKPSDEGAARASFGDDTAFPSGAVWDDFARLLAGAGQIAQAAGAEASGLWQAQLEQLKTQMDLVPRESFDAVAEMAAKALEKIAELEARIAALEGKAQKKPAKKPSEK